jgi:hypothetical protein
MPVSKEFKAFRSDSLDWETGFGPPSNFSKALGRPPKAEEHRFRDRASNRWSGAGQRGYTDAGGDPLGHRSIPIEVAQQRDIVRQVGRHPIG